MNFFIMSVILFALAALLGVFLLSKILGNKETPKGISITHGTLALVHGGLALSAFVTLVLQ